MKPVVTDLEPFSKEDPNLVPEITRALFATFNTDGYMAWWKRRCVVQ